MKSFKKVAVMVCCAMAIVLLPVFAGISKAESEESLAAGMSTWKNELGSTLELDVDRSGNIKGFFTTAVGCGIGVRRSLTGSTNSGAGDLAFVVNFEECNSITAWNGFITKNGTQLQTLWLLTQKGGNWNSTLIGANTFTRQQ